MPHFSNNIRALFATALFSAVAACGPSTQDAAPQAPPAPAVDIMVVHKTRVESTRELPGRARAYREAGAEAVAGYRKVLAGLLNAAERDGILRSLDKG